MVSDVVRRPLPALISLIALLILTGLVWWRVVDRDTGASAQGPSCPSRSASATPTPTPTGRTGAALPAPSSVDVRVLNSTARAGLAGTARTELRKAGFRSTRPASDFTGGERITGVGQIRYGASSAAAATLLRYYLPGATLVRTGPSAPRITVVLGPSFHAVQSTSAAQRAIAADRTSAAPRPTSTTSPRC